MDTTIAAVQAGADPARPGATLISVAGELDRAAATQVSRLVQRALMTAVPLVTLDLAGITGFVPAGIAELSQAVAAGCRLEKGVKLVLGGEISRQAAVALCRCRVDRRVWQSAPATGDLPLRR